MPGGSVICVYMSLVAVVSAGNINYCGSRMCGNTDAHTFCQYSEGPGPECVGYITADLSPEEKSRVIGRLNRRRNEAASGRLRGLYSAGNMMKLRWVEELAREAQRWADQCRLPQTPEENDDCRDLYSVPVGQVVASVVGEAPGLRVESMVDIWYMQNIHYRGNATIYIPPNTKTGYYGDFGQIMWAQSYMVGCGRSRFMIPSQGRLRTVERLVCNIAPRGPPPARPLWSPSAPATLCPPRSKPDNILTALCDIKQELSEITEVDESMSIEEHLLLYTVLDIEQNETLNYEGSLDEIYLTRLAVATMDITATTKAYFNSMQRRDITEVILLDDTIKENISTSQIELTLQETTTLASNIFTKKKLSLIGRPKSYNIEELNDIEYKVENDLPSEDIVKKEKEFYPEYEFVEPIEENATENATENIALTNYSESFNSVLDDNKTNTQEVTELNQDVKKEAITGVYQNSSMISEETTQNYILSTDVGVDCNNPLVGDNKTQIVAMGNDTALNNIDDDYFTDPETVRELQEALERLERDMSTESSTDRQAKVRRELRGHNLEEKRPPEEHLFDERFNAELERNKTLERGPMYNMVLKYMPYLREYQGSLLPQDSNSATRASSSVLLVLLFCL